MSATTAFVFDLDDTLMPTEAMFARNRPLLQSLVGKSAEDVRQTYASFIPFDESLLRQLSDLRGPKYLLTNGTRSHAYAALHALGVQPLFAGQLDRNSSPYMKPHPQVYEILSSAIVGEMPTVRRIVRDAAADDYGMQSIIVGIVKSYPFLHRRSES